MLTKGRAVASILFTFVDAIMKILKLLGEVI
jgi:hypothetical protein